MIQNVNSSLSDKKVDFSSTIFYLDANFVQNGVRKNKPHRLRFTIKRKFRFQGYYLNFLR
jgi:hypothetical protein